jgi:hypothetical protein
LISWFHPFSCIFSGSCQVLSSRPTKYLMNSSMSICHKIVHESATLLYIMLTSFPLQCSDNFFKSTATDHHIFLLLKLNQICPLVCSKSNSTNLQQEHILESIMNISFLEYMFGILYTMMNFFLKCANDIHCNYHLIPSYVHGDMLQKLLLNQPIYHKILCTSVIKPLWIFLPKIWKQTLQTSQKIVL